MNSKSTTFFALLVFLKVQISEGLRNDNEDVLTITPPVIAREKDESATFVCTNPEGDVENLQWSRNDTTILSMNNSRLKDENGTLTIENIIESDAGDYICTNTDTNITGTGQLKFYVMPSYFKEAMIVIGINVVLIVIFLICTVWTTVRQKRNQRRKKGLGKRQMY
ncbi:hypothetical protein CHS0354_027269 [Potamilus streckersoni]|uniref:Ig-like domain-containing protein n=1 Tax=Potamilus streckersoni TaxID=2493646 RepID=A0AAE0T848_9BIVA|nr:hypothetical protein CHS0354_027269 [Potamilus streckersoni]